MESVARGFSGRLHERNSVFNTSPSSANFRGSVRAVNELAVVAFPPPEEVHKALAARTSGVEELVRNSFAATLGARFPTGLALAAVGGFGRSELFPSSDVDLLLLVGQDDLLQPARSVLSAFLQSLWDSGLRPSHSVHNIEECVV